MFFMLIGARFSVSTGGAPDSPTNLVTSEVTHHSFRATWTGPEGPVEQYRVEYMTVSGEPKQVRCCFVTLLLIIIMLKGSCEDAGGVLESFYCDRLVLILVENSTHV